MSALLLGTRPRLHRVLAPAAILVAALSVLQAGLVLLAACRREPAPPLPISEIETAQPAVLRVCADPDALPFSNLRGEGFENALAEMLARHRGQKVAHEWHVQRRGFVREALGAGRCDVVMGVPTSLERVLVTRPYYRSTHVGDDYANTPPAHPLARRAVVRPEIDRLLDGFGVPRAPRGES
jgi:ABC-type amino acid transport substrate-binding protein